MRARRTHVRTAAPTPLPQPRWDSFQRMMQPLASAIPVMVAPGNHEIDGLDLFTAFNARFAAMPFPAGSADGPQYYSYETGPLHVVVLNAFGACAPESGARGCGAL